MNILYYSIASRYEGGNEELHTILDAKLQDVFMVPKGENECEIKVKISDHIFTIKSCKIFDSDDEIKKVVSKIIDKFFITPNTKILFVNELFEGI